MRRTDCYRTFSSEQFDNALALSQSSGAPGAGEYLTRYINAIAGERPSAQWFHRIEAGAGEATQGVNVGASLRERTLSVNNFPAYFLSCADEAHAALIAGFNDWQAPWLLVLENLDATERWRLEQQTRKRALEVDRQHRLYPAVADGLKQHACSSGDDYLYT